MAETERELIRFEYDDIELTGYDPAWQSDYLIRRDWTDDFGRQHPVAFIRSTTAGYRQIYGLTDSVAAESTGYQLQGKVDDEITVTGRMIGDHYSGDLADPIGVYLIMGNGNVGAPTSTDYQPRIDAGNVVLGEAILDSSTGGDFEITATIESIEVDNANVYLMFCELTMDGGQRQPGILELAVEVSRVIAEDEPDEPEDELEHHEALARLVVRNIDATDDEDTLALARLHVELVEGFVYGYTRGKGFSSEGIPERPLRNVIIMAASKLTYNPEQVSWFRSGEYSERPAQWKGWSLMDLSVLNMYRKRWA